LSTSLRSTSPATAPARPTGLQHQRRCRARVSDADGRHDSEQFVVEFDLPGVNPDLIDLGVERNVVTVEA
jgi:HSP20 family molecular chaperone IbpA